MNLVKRALTFFKEVNAEVRKVVWPVRAEVVGASVVVCILAVFFAVVLGAMDAGFSTLVKWVIG